MISHRISTSARVIALALGAAFAAGGQAKADQVIPDDLIVQGSLCVGLDCVNNENFGFDTIRLKENNTRIHFDDTSVNPGFPATDWRIIANDSASGGSNKFSVEDSTAATTPFTIEGAATTNSIFVDSTGRIGFRTASPVLDLHVNTSNTPAMRLEQNNSGGFSAQTWDIGANEANFFVRDATNGSTLPFRIRPGAPTSSIDISAVGNVGIGTASPGFNSAFASRILTVFSSTSRGMLELVNGQADAAGNTAGQVGFFANGNANPNKQVAAVLSDTVGATATNRGGNLRFFTKPNNGAIAEQLSLSETGTVRLFALPNCAAGIVSSANGTLSCLASSRRFKDITGDLPHSVALANVMALRPQTGSYKDTPDVKEHWFVAEEVAQVDPALVGLNEGQPHVVKTQNVVADLVAVVQQQQREIEELKRRLSPK